MIFPIRIISYSLVPGLLCACGIGPGAGSLLTGGDGGGGGPGDAQTVVGDLQTLGTTRVSPLEFSFRITDQESDAATVQVSCVPPGGGAEVAASLVGGPSLADLASSPAGVVHAFQWDFAGQLASGAGYAEDVQLVVRIAGGGGVASTPAFDVGNDAPSVSVTGVPSGETAGIVPIQVVLGDSSSDLVTLIVEYDDASAPTGWKPATAASVTTVAASPGGVAATYFWDSLADEPDVKLDALLRIVADDGNATGTAAVAGPVTVDNNAEPTAQVNGSAFFSTSDRRRGIPVPFRVVDDEGDPLRVVFQWRRPFESFPVLPADRAGLEAALADPAQRASLRIATERAPHATGLAFATAPDAVRLHGDGGPALAALAGRQLELLRDPGAPADVSAAWAVDPLVAAVALVPLGSGETVLAVDRPFAGSWRMRRIHLATAAVEASVAGGASGDPSAVHVDEARGLAWLATDVAGTWSVTEVDLATGAATPLHTTGGAVATGTVRALLPVGTDKLWLTVGSALVDVDLTSGQEVALLSGLQTPWGLCRDPRGTRRVYVAERDWVNPSSGLVQGRVIALDVVGLAATTLANASLERPSALALEAGGARLLIVADDDPLDGTRELWSWTVRGEGLGAPRRLVSGVVDGTWTIATGPDLLRVLTAPALPVLASGDVEQTRTIVAYDAITCVATVAPPFDPPAGPSRSYRIKDEVIATAGGPPSVDDVFVWDASDLPAGGQVVLRAVPYDAERGLASDTGVPRTVGTAVSADPVTVGGPGVTDGVRDAVLADLNGDGEADIVSANADGDDLTVFHGQGGGVFPAAPSLTLQGVILLAPMDQPAAVAAVDFDDDGDLDLVSCNRGSNNIVLFRNTGLGFTTLLNPLTALNAPESLAAADVNGDGRTDLVVADTGNDRLVVYFQLLAGLYLLPGATPGAGVVDAPVDVVTADLDADGDPDFVSANANGDDVTVFLGAGGTLPAAPTFRLGGSGITDGPSAVAVGDVDGDGRLDIVCANRDGNDVAVFLQNAPGGFSALPSQTLTSAAGPIQPRALSLLDVTDDGRLDIVVTQTGTELLAFHHDVGGIAFSSEPLRMDASGFLMGPRALAGGDLDGDGNVDLVVANELADDLAVLLRRGAGRFGTGEPDLRLGGPADTPDAGGAALGDLDGDGDLDLVVLNRSADTVALFDQFSPAVFSSVPRLELGPHAALDDPSFVTTGDVDGDLLADVVVASAGAGTLAVFLQRPGGAFGPGPDQVVGGGSLVDPTWIAPVDVTGDGACDLVCADGAGDRVCVFAGDGAGNLAAAPSSSHGGPATTPEPVHVLVDDLDGDGDLDLATANAGNGTLSVFLALAPGVLPALPTETVGGPATTSNPRAVAAVDVDLDGDRDLVSANRGSNSVTVFLRDGSTWGAAPDITVTHATLAQPCALAVADLDDDGDADVVVASASTGRISICEQVAPGQFASVPRSIGGPGLLLSLELVLGADVDGDGDPDLLALDAGAEQVVVYFNSH